jgi:CheY-like chemotaxis protein
VTWVTSGGERWTEASREKVLAVGDRVETGRKLLMVGFERAVRGRVDESLAPLGHRLTAAGDGAKALRLVSRRRFDALLVSHPLAGAPTSRFLSGIRNPDSACRTSPLLLVTPERNRSDAEAYLGRGATRVLALEQLPQAIPEVLTPLLDVAPRAALRVPIRVEVLGQRFPRRVFWETVNLSATGMLLRVPHTLPCATDLRFELFVPGLPKPVCGEARVVRRTVQRWEPYPGIAVRFLSFAGSDFELLASRLRRLVADR